MLEKLKNLFKFPEHPWGPRPKPPKDSYDTFNYPPMERPQAFTLREAEPMIDDIMILKEAMKTLYESQMRMEKKLDEIGSSYLEEREKYWREL